MRTTINGRRHDFDESTELSAVEVLREDLDLTGTKLACGVGVCGACTVHLDDVPVASCLLPNSSLEGRNVTTIEGIDGLHPIQRAFAARDALQCGFCTPGFVMEAIAFYSEWRSTRGQERPGRDAIAGALAGHLCRCGAYPAIIDAVQDACEGLFDDIDVVQSSRVDAVEKVTGAARYTVDIHLPGQLEGVIVRSEHPHALIRGIDSSAAEKMEGVSAVVNLLAPDNIVRFTGAPIAAIAAVDTATARSAARMLEVSYKPRPASLSFETNRTGGDTATVFPDRASRKHSGNVAEGPIPPSRWKGNVRGPSSLGWRRRTARKRIDAARASGDARLFEATFTTAAQSHTPLEPHAAVARWDEAGGIELHVSTQAITAIRNEVAERWDLDEARVNVIANHVGGGFGAKLSMTEEVVAAVALSRKAGAPVRVVFDRHEELEVAGFRPGTRSEIALLADADGSMRSLTMTTWADNGAGINSAVAALALLIYGKGPKATRDYDVVTNGAPGRPFRGPGGPPAAWALEQAVDEIAHRLGKDSIELRRRWDGNSKRRALYDVAARLPMWADRQPTGSQSGRFRRGVGLTASNWLYFLDPDVQVEVAVDSGMIIASTAVQDMGTGIKTVMARAVGEVFEVPPQQVQVAVGDSSAVYGPTSGGSRTTTSVAPATVASATKLRDAIVAKYAEEQGLRDVTGERDGLHHEGNVTPWSDVISAIGPVSGTTMRARDRWGHAIPLTIRHLRVGRGFSGAVHLTEVEVDTRLGKVRPLRAWGGIAAGKMWAPAPARSQVEGSIVQGLSYALYESRECDPATGRVLSANLEDFRIMGIGDTPEIDVYFHEEGWDHVPGGGVGIGELATLSVAASVGNAIFNATGWRPLDLPIRPDRVVEGLGA